MSGQDIIHLLLANEVLQRLPFTIVQHARVLLSHLRLVIMPLDSNYDPAYPPSALPDSVHNFLCHALHLPDSDVHTLWTSLKQDIWASAIPALGEAEICMLMEHGAAWEIGVFVAPLFLLMANGNAQVYTTCSLRFAHVPIRLACSVFHPIKMLPLSDQ
jgi:hypothetical protein